MNATFDPANRETLDTLQRALELVEGFALYFVRNNLPAQSGALLARLAEMLGPERVVFRVDLDEGASVIRRLLTESVRVAPGGSLHVFGLERQMPGGAVHPPVLQQLNLAREHFRRLPCPVVFWLRDEALTRLARGAPDFWAWRSGVFEFVPEPDWVNAESLQHVGQGTLAWRDLPAQEKSTRILALEGLLEDYKLLEQDGATYRASAEIALELGWLYLVAYRVDEAAQVLDSALHLFRAVGDRLGEANVLQAMGDVQAFRDDRDTALDSYAQALTLFRAVGDRLGEANVLQAMGDVQAFRKENDTALDSYAQALTLFRAVGDRLGEANVLKAMGDVQAFRKENDTALDSYAQALTLFRAVGDRLGEANVLKA
ncbi:MAG: tetratricopeptide repeat protein, partial [Anaerolineae bacterium]|nr:tetratricopeptide repeat protein [Anaerolineae bacterium]